MPIPLFLRPCGDGIQLVATRLVAMPDLMNSYHVSAEVTASSPISVLGYGEVTPQPYSCSKNITKGLTTPALYFYQVALNEIDNSYAHPKNTQESITSLGEKTN